MTLRIAIALIFITTQLWSQNTVGLLSLNDDLAYDGYTLLYPHRQPNVYLINNCGEIVHTWEGAEATTPGNMAYLQANGNIVVCSRPASFAGNPIWAGGGGATIEVKDWDNNVLHSYTLNDENGRLHHDIDVLPNGNVIAIAWELKTQEEAIAAGRDTTLLSEDKLWPDYIMELNSSLDSIVWEWHAWDHLIQDYDETKANYGVVADHPEKIDLNWDTNSAKADWMHTNAIDYHPQYDQIMISVPTFHELWVIDHSTTTAEAAGSTGGLYGMGGDIIYRWGNPQTYRAGDSTDQKLFYQHDTKWNLDYISPGHEDFGKVMLYNNRVGSDYSTVNILDPMFDDYDGNYMIMDGQFIPADFDITLTHPTPTQMWSTGLSSFQQLPNDNYLITVGRFGYTFEMTPDQEIVWEYVTPIAGGNVANQGDTLSINQNLTFRSSKIPADFEAFEGKDLTAKGWIENNPNEGFCLELDTEDTFAGAGIKMFPVPANQELNIDLNDAQSHEVSVYDLAGRLIASQTAVSNITFDVATWTEGVYFIKVDNLSMGRAIISK